MLENFVYTQLKMGNVKIGLRGSAGDGMERGFVTVLNLGYKDQRYRNTPESINGPEH